MQVLGRLEVIKEECGNSDFVIVCSAYKNFTEQECFGKARLIRFDFMRLLNEISPETATLCRKTRVEVKGAIGVVCGMSYEQKGIEYEQSGTEVDVLWQDRHRTFIRIIIVLCGLITKL